MKKVLALVLALVLTCLALGGCGGSDDKDTKAAGGTKSAEGTKGSEGGEAASGDFKGKIKIGVICPKSGTAGDGVYMEAVCKMAAEEINAAGGMDGLEVELYVEDDEGTAQKSVTVAQKLVNQDGVDIVVGAQNSACTLANMLVTQEAGIVQITPGSSSPSITEQGNDWIFRTSISDLTAATSIMEYCKEKGYTNVALIHSSGDFGMTASAAINEHCGDYGLTIALEEQFNDDDVDFTTILNKIQSEEPDAIICWGYFSAASHICQQMVQNDVQIPFMGYGFNNPQFTELGAEYVEGAIVASGFTELSAATNDKVQPFIDAFTAYYGSAPTQVCAQSYDTMYLIKQTIEEIGGENFSEEAFKEALKKQTYTGVTGEMSFDEKNDIVKECTLVQYDAEGNQVLVEW
ncbi:MAG: ABC transporter substrate-binding protein [Lachnospiraceae bacterium]|jgi:branched-chain amino acid transport system substrate-binding protein|nr:ABC transporter substrate-binding protein [Lachnospiraceae bacterium]